MNSDALENLANLKAEWIRDEGENEQENLDLVPNKIANRFEPPGLL